MPAGHQKGRIDVSQASFELRESRWSEGLDTYAPTIQAFADHLAGLDYRAYTVMRLASAARHFCVWFRFGSAMPASRAPKSTFEPIRQRSLKHLPRWRPRRCNAVASRRLISFWPCCRTPATVKIMWSDSQANAATAMVPSPALRIIFHSAYILNSCD